MRYAVVMVGGMKVVYTFNVPDIWQHQVHVVSWSTALWRARTTGKRRPGRLLILGCIPSVDIFFKKVLICCGYGGWVFSSSIILTCLTTLSTYESVVDHTMDGKDNLEEKTSEVVDIRNVLLRKNSCSFGFCSNEGEEGPCPKFLSPFHKCIFGQ